MSDTPRTDEEIKHYGGLQRVSADFARKLERELAESNALLLQARTMLDDAAPFDATFDGTGDFYEERLEILDSNPNGLLEKLVDGGFIRVDSKSVRRRLKAQKGKR